jgi:lipoate-protein ligase A
LNVTSRKNEVCHVTARHVFQGIAIWREGSSGAGAEHMALDETMLRLADRPVLRVYGWAQREVTFGYPQRWNEARDFAAGRPLTRRCTGGGFVEHGSDSTVTLAVPAAHPFARLAPAETYRRIHEAILAALGGESLRLAGAEDCACGPACFASPARHDVLDGARKIAGGAQRRSREGFLYQGSVQGAHTGENFAERLAVALAGGITEWRPPTGWESVRDELVRARYGCAEWNQRR